MGAWNYDELKRHVGHKIVCVAYGLPTKPDKRTYLHKSIRKKEDQPANVSVECLSCHEVLLDFDRPDKGKR